MTEHATAAYWTEELKNQVRMRCELYWLKRSDCGCSAALADIQRSRVFLSGASSKGRIKGDQYRRLNEELTDLEKELEGCTAEEEVLRTCIESGEVTETTPQAILTLSAKITELSQRELKIYLEIVN